MPAAASLANSLAEKIRVARVNKERSDQLVEKKIIGEQQQEYDRAFNQFVAGAAAEAEAQEQENQAKRREANVRARMVLEEQMQEKAVSGGVRVDRLGLEWRA